MKIIKASVVAGVVAILLAAAPAHGAVKMLKSTFVGDPGSITCGGADAASSGEFVAVSTTLPYYVGAADTIVMTVFAAVNSTATVLIQTAPTPTGPWYTVATVTNPSTTGEQWSIPRVNYVRFNVSAWTAETIRFCLGAWRVDKQIW